MKYVSPPDQQAYYEQVWEWVRQVPHGKVVTYGQVATMITCPEGVQPEDYSTFGSRWVGKAMGACPDDVPWQRVINSQGKISERPGSAQQRYLLEQEGVVFTKDRINLHLYQWRGPGHKDQPQQMSFL